MTAKLSAMPRPTNALIVDDEAHVRVFVRLLLKELGIEKTWEAADGGQAILMIQEHWPELVLLDVNLPILNGIEVLRQIHDVAPEIPVVMVTSQMTMKTVAEAAELGAVAYVLKHSPKAVAVKALREALDIIEQGGGPASAVAD